MARISYLSNLCNILLRHVEDRTALRLFRQAYQQTFEAEHKGVTLTTSKSWTEYALGALYLRKSLNTKLRREHPDTPGRDKSL